MWRFILISFVFLGWAFYMLSGGSDYEPEEGSLQNPTGEKSSTQVRTTSLDDAAKKMSDEAKDASDAAMNAADEQTGRAGDVMTDQNVMARDVGAEMRDQTGEATVPASSVTAGRGADGVSGAESSQNASQSAGNQGAEDAESNAAVEAAVEAVRFKSAVDAFADEEATAGNRERAAGADIRTVTGNRVNLRSGPGTGNDVVGKLRGGDSVEVIAREAGWFQIKVLETGQTGWMADWLLSKENN